jgi:putative DNA primase/helicase
LNTPEGIVDLRTGQMRPHDRAALCSMTTVAPADLACPRWQRFLDQVTAGDQDLQRFLRRIAGYGLTGSTREHALFFFYGTGANGKGTFLNTLTAILGDYAKVAGMDTFTESHTDRHPTELAMLRGARIVAAQETEEGRRWAESRIKALTGGDPITARFMRQDFFTYTPQFKLLIAGNHKPGLRNIDEAIRRRFHLLPFTVRIPPEARDPNLFDKLKEEWPAILGWALQGCLEWQAEGLNPPAAVIEATAEYFDDEDSFGRWLVLRPRCDGARDDARSLRRLDGVGGALRHVGRQRAEVPRRAEGARVRFQKGAGSERQQLQRHPAAKERLHR